MHGTMPYAQNASSGFALCTYLDASMYLLIFCTLKAGLRVIIKAPVYCHVSFLLRPLNVQLNGSPDLRSSKMYPCDPPLAKKV